ncbi:CNNM domain-containing protein [Falsirhodobacter xinxiangensis]|uniref:CNNM domain-containing protein n=1 Tax=Falsirhodobacter xinxiangensis TaxID=2530049 RepID=UPI001C7034BD|nr:hemolysin family protein [Rhodobacter xinxiangensis]
MMNDPLIVTIVTLALIALSALFVIIEFSLLGARRHRLEELAPESRSARAALRGMNDLTMMLALAQLGITACTFALGAITKPALDAWLGPVLLSAGLPAWLAGGTSFALALFVVTFLHLVVGEMAPKSWAIAHPERSARSISVIAQGLAWPLRPLLRWMNGIANSLVRASGVEPVESAAVGGRDIATIRQLVEHSAQVGALEPEMQRQLSGFIGLSSMPVSDLVAADQRLAAVPAQATGAEVRAAARQSGHMRILMEAGHGKPMSFIHVRDTLVMADDTQAATVARPALRLDAQMPVYEALARLRGAGVQIAIVKRGTELCGIITLADILKLVLPAGIAVTKEMAPGAA